MHVRDLLVQQYGMVYEMIRRNVEGISHSDSLTQAAGGGNTANWILGHLTNVQNAVMQMIGAPPVWQSSQLERARFDNPISDAADAIDWDALVEHFNGSRDACLSALGALSDEALARKMPHPFGGETTLAALLGTLAVHQTYHTGQLGMGRRAVGLKTAILAPGQTEPI